jgi:hypothetical protein
VVVVLVCRRRRRASYQPRCVMVVAKAKRASKRKVRA